jgi:hypothetical protein
VEEIFSLFLLLGTCGIVLFWGMAVFGRAYWRAKSATQKWSVLKIRPNLLSERNPAVAEQLFSALHGLYKKRNLIEIFTKKPQTPFSLEIANKDGSVHFYVRVPTRNVSFVQGQLHAQYPDAEIEIVPEYTPDISQDTQVAWAELRLSSAYIWPIKRHSQFEDKTAKTLHDPISGILEPFSQKEDGLSLQLQICCRPMNPTKFRSFGMKYLTSIGKKIPDSGFFSRVYQQACLDVGIWKHLLYFPLRIILLPFFTSKSESANTSSAQEPVLETNASHDRENIISAATDKLSKLPFLTSVRVACHYADSLSLQAEQKIEEVVGAFQQFHLPQLNGFVSGKIHHKQKIFFDRYFSADNPHQLILNTEELATLFHLPNKTVFAPNLDWVTSRKLEPPKDIPLDSEKGITLLGETNFRSRKKLFGIREDDRRRHIYIAGKTGMGKSTLLENMIFSDIQDGKGVAVIDPHGDLAEAVLNFVPKSRTNDVVLFDPADAGFPVSFNILECQNPMQRHLVASGVVGVFKKIFAESWGPRLEHILRNTLMALIEAQGTSILGVMRMLSDESYQQEILQKVHDPMVLSFWENEFGKWPQKQKVEAISPIQNKVGQFLSSSLIRNILGQTKSSLDLRFAMDKKKIIIINLSKGRIGEDNSALLGSLLVTKFQLDVMSRADIPEKERQDFYLYVDEFQNFATDAFATILSEARKYRLNLTVANQYLAQMSDEVREAVFGNVGTMVSFQVGFDDAESLSEQFGGEEVITAADIGALPKYQVFLRLMVNGMPSKVFSAATLPPPALEEDEGRRERILKVCRMRYGRPREKVEEQILKWAKNSRNEK